MSDRRRFLKRLTSLPLAAVLAKPQAQAKGSILLVHEWWALI